MTVVGPDGNLWSAGDVRVDGLVATVGLRPLGPKTLHTATTARHLRRDGHVINGSWSSISPSPKPPPRPPGAPDHSGTGTCRGASAT